MRTFVSKLIAALRGTKPGVGNKKSCSVYFRGDEIYITSKSLTTDGLWLYSAPYFKLQASDSASSLGASIIEALEATRRGVPTPNLRSSGDEFLASTGFRSFSSLERGAKYFSVSLGGKTIDITPTVRGKRGGFDFLPDETRTCSVNADEVGETLVAMVRETNRNESLNETPRGLSSFETPASSTDAALRDDIAKKGLSAIYGNDWRLYPADAEDLAEGRIGEFIQSIGPFLVSEGVQMPQVTNDISPEGYVVLLDDDPHTIYDESELARESGEPGLIWGLSMARGFKILNELLEAAGSVERVYAVNGGNDLFALFLTPDLFRLISQHPHASRQDLPYEPIEDYPWFGQPH